jgi:D-alanine-D-alanine ligase
MRNLRVLALVPEGNVPPEAVDDLTDRELVDIKMEFDVISTLRGLGHEVRSVDVTSNLSQIRSAILEWNPHIAFNMLEDFHGISVYDQHLVSFLELMRTPYTGCNPRGIMLARDKVLCKKLLTFHKIRVPRFEVFARGKAVRRPRRLEFPLLVKSSTEESSTGISQASVVKSDGQFEERVRFIHEKVETDAIAEEYINGRELYVGVLGNRRLETFPIWELVFQSLPDGTHPIATERVKFNLEIQRKYGVDSRAATGLPDGFEDRASRLCKRIYRILGMSGYGRIDLRLREDGQIFVLEANPNPDISADEEFSMSAEAAGHSYEELIGRIVSLGLSYPAEWKA